MPATLEELRAKRTALTTRAQTLVAAAESENRELTADEQKEFDGACAEVERLDKTIRNREKVDGFGASAGRRSPEPTETREIHQRNDDDAERDPFEAARRDKHFGRQHRTKYFAHSASDQHSRDVFAYRCGRWAAATIYGHGPSQRWCKANGMRMTRSMTVGANESGGFVVPTEMIAEIIALKERYGVFGQFAQRRPITAETNQPVRKSGLTVYYPDEGGTITGSDAQFGNVKLTPHKAAILTKMSSELEEDALVSLADFLIEEFGQAFALAEDQAAFNGDGSPTYGNMTGLNSALLAGSRVTAATGNTSFGTLDLDDFESVVGKLPEYAEQQGMGARWFISKAGWAASMARLSLAAGGVTAAEVAGGVVKSFMGYPVSIVQVMNTTLTTQTSAQGVCYFGNLSLAAILAERRAITIARSTEKYFDTDEIAVRATKRHDIVIHGTGTASVAGPMIALDLPGS